MTRAEHLNPRPLCMQVTIHDRKRNVEVVGILREIGARDLVIECEDAPPINVLASATFYHPEPGMGGIAYEGRVKCKFVVHQRRGFRLRISDVLDVPGFAQVLGPERARTVAC